MRAKVNLLFIAALLAHFSFTWQINFFSAIKRAFASNNRRPSLSQSNELKPGNPTSESISTFEQPNHELFIKKLKAMEKEDQMEESIPKQNNPSSHSYEEYNQSVLGNKATLSDRTGNLFSSEKDEKTNRLKNTSLPAPETSRSELEEAVKTNEGNGIFELDLTKHSSPFKYEKINFHSSALLILTVDETSQLEYFSVVLDTREYDELNIKFQDGFNQDKELVKIFRENPFESFALINRDKINSEICYPLIEELIKETSFLTQLQYLECERLSFKSYLKLLEIFGKLNAIDYQQLPNSLPINLKSLRLLIDESTDDTIYPMRIDSVEELDLSFQKKMNFKYPIEQLIKMFPKLKRLDIYVRGTLVPFEIKNQELKSLTIFCGEFTDQSEFMEQLREREIKTHIYPFYTLW